MRKLLIAVFLSALAFAQTTPNLGLSKPTVGGSTNVWGGLLNGDMDLLDSILGGAVLPVGGGLNFNTLTVSNFTVTGAFVWPTSITIGAHTVNATDPGVNGGAFAVVTGNPTPGNCMVSGGGPKLADGGSCSAGANPDNNVKYCQNFSAGTDIQGCVDAAANGLAILPKGTISVCNVTVTNPVMIVGQGPKLSILSCGTANAPVLHVSGTSTVTLKDFGIRHSILPTCPGGAGSATCGEGLVIDANSQDDRIINLDIQKNWNGMNLGNTTWGQIMFTRVIFNENDGVFFTFTNGVSTMQWHIYGSPVQQNKGHGWNLTNTTANHQVTCPRWHQSPTYCNQGDGWHISASGGSPSNGIANCDIDDSYGSTNNGNGVFLDGGSGARNMHIRGSEGMGYELSGQCSSGIGYAGNPATPTCTAGSCLANVGNGILITNNNDNSNLPSINLTDVEAYSNGACGIRSENNGTTITGGVVLNNGQDGNSDTTNCGVSLGGNKSTIGGMRFAGSTQTIGLEVHGSAADLLHCNNNITATTPVKQNVALSNAACAGSN